MGYQTIRYDVDGHVATITLNRPEAGNGFTTAMSAELCAAFGVADDDPNVRVVILAAAGKNFCVGADLSGGSFATGHGATGHGATGSGATGAAPAAGDALDGVVPAGWNEPAGVVSGRVFEMNKPVIAAVHGAAVGAGSTMLLPADFRLAQVGSRLGFPFVRRGIAPEGMSAWFLPRLVGLGKALEWLVGGRLIPAAEALEAGLVTSVHEDVRAAARELAAELAAHVSPVGAAITRRMLYFGLTAPSPYDVRPVDSRIEAYLVRGRDAAEGVSAFFARREPRFPGRVPADLPDWLPWGGGGDRPGDGVSPRPS